MPCGPRPRCAPGTHRPSVASTAPITQAAWKPTPAGPSTLTSVSSGALTMPQAAATALAASQALRSQAAVRARCDNSSAR
jgi:hypothetical protein